MLDLPSVTTITEIEKLTLPERLEAMELLWDSLVRDASGVISPDWHGEVLAGRLEKIPGIAEQGLFLGYAKSALIARGADVTVLRAGAKEEPLERFAELP